VGQNQSIPRGIGEGFRVECGNLLEAGLSFPARLGILVPPNTSLDRHLPGWLVNTRSYDDLVSSR
jgi:hypothetical protein